MKIRKTLLGVIAALTIGIVGDHYNIEKRLLGEIYEAIWPADEGYPSRYTDIEIRYRNVNGKTRVYLYDRHAKIWSEINEDLTAGSNIAMMRHLLLYGAREAYWTSKEKFNETKEWIEDQDIDEWKHKARAGKEYLEGKVKKYWNKAKKKWEEIRK